MRKFPKFYWRILRPKMIKFMFKLTLLNLTIEDLDTYKLFPKEPNTSVRFKKFLRLAKDNNYAGARALLYEDKFLVYHFDFVRVE